MNTECADKLLPGISVVLLAYREADNLRVLIPQIKEALDSISAEYDLMIIDSAQPLDDTAAVCAQFDALCIPQEEPHFAGAFRTGIRYARRELFLIMDADGSHGPEHIPALVSKFAEGYDLVIGSRYVKGGQSFDSPVSKAMSLMLNTCFRLCLGIPAHDLSTDFRLYRTAWLQETELHCEVYDVLEEVLLKLRLLHPEMRVGEVPIIFRKRLLGESKRRLIPFILSYIRTLIYLTLLRIFRSDERAERAMHFLRRALFVLIGVALLLLAANRFITCR